MKGREGAQDVWPEARQGDVIGAAASVGFATARGTALKAPGTTSLELAARLLAELAPAGSASETAASAVSASVSITRGASAHIKRPAPCRGASAQAVKRPKELRTPSRPGLSDPGNVLSGPPAHVSMLTGRASHQSPLPVPASPAVPGCSFQTPATSVRREDTHPPPSQRRIYGTRPSQTLCHEPSSQPLQGQPQLQCQKSTQLQPDGDERCLHKLHTEQEHRRRRQEEGGGMVNTAVNGAQQQAEADQIDTEAQERVAEKNGQEMLATAQQQHSHLASHNHVPSHAGFVQASMKKFRFGDPENLVAPSLQSCGVASTVANLQNLSKWTLLELPQFVIDIFQSRGIKEPFDWQVSCLTSKTIQQRKNLVYALPTSAGKTFVAEVLVIQRMLGFKTVTRRRWDSTIFPSKVMMIFPYVSLCIEKKQQFQEFGDKLDFVVEPFYDHHGTFPLPTRVRQLCISTIEKAERIFTSLFEEGRGGELGLVVVDELHFVGENSRGCLLESLLTRLRIFLPRCQIIGMSATMPNLGDMTQWLGAEKFDGQDFKRPVELLEHVVCGRELLHKKGNVKDLLPAPAVDDPDLLVHLAMKSVVSSCGNDDGSLLVFCPTVKETEAVAKQLKAAFGQRVSPSVSECIAGTGEGDTATRQSELQRRRHAVKEELQSLSSDLNPSNPVLQMCVLHGIAFHNAKLSKEARRIIEDAFKERVLNVLTSTSTLAAGVNLPAACVIITRAFVGREAMKANTYKQMVGRAGRTGMSTSGKAYLLCKPQEKERCMHLMQHGPPEVRSQLMATSTLSDRDHAGNQVYPIKAEQESVSAQASFSSIEHADEFIRAVLNLVCSGRLPPKMCPARERGVSEIVGPMGSDGVDVAEVQAWMRKSFFGVIWTRLEREAGHSPDANSIQVIPAIPDSKSVASVSSSRPASAAATSTAGKATRISLEDMVKEALLWLETQQLICKKPFLETGLPHGEAGSEASTKSGTKIGGTRLHPTALGRATYLSTLPIRAAMEVHAIMTHARKEGVVLVDQLHLLFMMTPVDQFCNRFLTDNSFWALLARKLDNPTDFDENKLRVLRRIGLDIAFVQKRATSSIMIKSSRYWEQDRKGKRFWLALIMQDLVEERSVDAVIASFSPADSVSNRLTCKELEDLQASGAMFSSKVCRGLSLSTHSPTPTNNSLKHAHTHKRTQVAHFAQNVGYEDLAILCQNMIHRIANGAREDIVPLCELPAIQATRARKLRRHNYKSLEDVAGAQVADIVRILDPKPEKAAAKIANKIIESAVRRERRWFVLERPRRDTNGGSETEVTVTCT